MPWPTTESEQAALRDEVRQLRRELAQTTHQLVSMRQERDKYHRYAWRLYWRIRRNEM